MSLIKRLKMMAEPLVFLIKTNSDRIDEIENKSVSAPESDELVSMLIELDALPAITDSKGAIYTDEKGAILMM